MSTFKDFLEKKGPKLFFLLISVQMILLVILALVDIFYNRATQEENKLKLDVYKWTILVLFSLSQYYYAWNAILKANVLQLFAYTLISTATFIASCIRMYQVTDNLLLNCFNYFYLFYVLAILILSYASYLPFYDIFLYRNVMKVGASIECQSRTEFINCIKLEIYRNYNYFYALMKLFILLSVATFTTFFFFFDTNWIYCSCDVFVICIALVAFFLAERGLMVESKNCIYIYYALIFIVQAYILARLLLILYHCNFQISLLENYDLYTAIIVFSTFISSSVVMIMNFYFGIECIEGFGNLTSLPEISMTRSSGSNL